MINTVIEKLPLASLAFLVYAIVGAVMLIVGTQDYGTFSHNILAFGIAVGALGVPRAISKVANGNPSANLLGFVDSLPIPSLVFIVFLIASFVLLAINHITFGAFSENVLEVGIACGAVQASKTAEHVFANSDPAFNPDPASSPIAPHAPPQGSASRPVSEAASESPTAPVAEAPAPTPAAPASPPASA